MAATSLLTLLDDIASALDDVAILTKIATKKAAGVLGDDLVLNAEQMIGIHAHRELAVIGAVAKGSAVNKLILIPFALFINFFAPMLVSILLILGGLYLCFEGFEKIIAKFIHKKSEFDAKDFENIDINQFEKDKIKSAIRTDFVLSAEIIIITLGIVAFSSFINQILVLVIISIIMTLGVYGLVACIVKLDDLGLILLQKKHLLNKIGMLLINTAPILMKILSVIGTIAMFLVGGSIITHEIPAIHHHTQNLSSLMSVLVELFIGGISGAILAIAYFTYTKIKSTPT